MNKKFSQRTGDTKDTDTKGTEDTDTSRYCVNLLSLRFGVVSNTVCSFNPGNMEMITTFITS